MQTIILMSTPTSASGSLLRIARILDRDRRRVRKFDWYVRTLTPDQIDGAVPPPLDHLFLFNNPPRFNRSVRLDDYRFVVNFRDPRDHACNSYAWNFWHPTSEPQDERRARLDRLQKTGIDQWVLSALPVHKRRALWDTGFWLLENADPESYAVATYAQLCLDFDGFVDNVVAGMGGPTQFVRGPDLECERPENLHTNTNWIGNQETGADEGPGRYLRELQPETIAALNEAYKDELRLMARYDPGFAHLYLEGL